MNPEDIHGKLKAQFGDAVGALVVTETKPGAKNPTRVDPFAVVEAARIQEVCRWLKSEAGLEFDHLSDETAVDAPKEEKIRVVYHLFSYKHRHSFCLKLELPRADPKCPTVEGVWKTANWFEREVYDLFGVRFEGHPDLRRIMMPDDWVGHPLRKDFAEQKSYHSMSTTRESPLDGFVRLDELAKSAKAN